MSFSKPINKKADRIRTHHFSAFFSMAGVNFRPAGVSDSSEDDDFVDEYRQYTKRTNVARNTKQNSMVNGQNKVDLW